MSFKQSQLQQLSRRVDPHKRKKNGTNKVVNLKENKYLQQNIYTDNTSYLMIL